MPPSEYHSPASRQAVPARGDFCGGEAAWPGRERTNDNAVVHAITEKMTAFEMAALEMAALAEYRSGR